MNRNDRTFSRLLRSPGGFTLIEVLVVIAILATLVAIATPSYISWRRNIEYREAARNINAALRAARTYAISDLRQYGVQFDNANRRFRFRRGDLALNSVNWDLVTQPGSQGAVFLDATIWTDYLAPRVTLEANTPEIRFSPDGTATFSVVPTAVAAPAIAAGTGGIVIRDETSTGRFWITVTPTGRIQVRQP